MHNQTIIACTGAPRSGLRVLATCFRILGFPAGNQFQPHPETIDSLLLQDLGQPAGGALPYDWMASEASSRAKARIDTFISQTGTLPDKPLQVNLNALTLPLWLDAFKKHAIKLKLIHIIRHPHEVALSLQANHHLDLTRGSILWLAYLRTAMRVIGQHNQFRPACDRQKAGPAEPCGTIHQPSGPTDNLPGATTPQALLKGFDRSEQVMDNHLITFDQLLADPVTTLGKISGSSLISSPLPLAELLRFVQPSLKHHHASQLPEPDWKTYGPFVRIYNQLRTGQKSEGTDSGIIDTLLQTLGQRAFRMTETENFRFPLPASQPADNRYPINHLPAETTPGNFPKRVYPDSQLSAKITFPGTPPKAGVSHTIPLIEDQWQKISLPVPDSGLLKSSPIDFSPMDCTGMVTISAIQLVNKSRNEVLWQCNNADSFETLKFSGHATRVAHRNQLALAVLGHDVRISIDPGQELSDCPLDIVIWLKVSAGSENFVSLFTKNPLIPAPNAFKLNNQLTHVLKTMTSMGEFHQKFKNRSEEFEKITTEDDTSLVKAKTFWGASIHLLPQNEVVSSKIYSFGLFEPELCSFFTDFLFQGATVLDVGAHIGLFSMLASELTGDTGKVFAFEPTPSTREVLQLNLNPYKQAVIIPKLVWHEKAELDFHDLGIQFSAFNTDTSDRLGPEQKKMAEDTLIKVEAVTLDNFCRDQEIKPDLIKIDAESSEMEVLKGMTILMDRIRPVITIEVGDMESTLKDGIPRSCKILEFAMSYDYVPIRPVAGRYEGHEVKEHYSYDNIIMVPRERLPVRGPLGTVVVQRGRFF